MFTQEQIEMEQARREEIKQAESARLSRRMECIKMMSR